MPPPKKRAIDSWVIIPYVGMGPVCLGMTRPQVRKAVGSKPKTYFKAETSKQPTDAFDKYSLHVYYNNDTELCEFIEMFWSQGDPPGGPELKGRGLLGRPYDRTLEWFRSVDPLVTTEGTGLRSDELGVTIFVPTTTENLPVAGIGVFARGYYKR